MAERVDLRPVAFFTHEGIICGNGPIILEPEDLSNDGARLLRLLSVVPVSAGDIEVAGLVECQARSGTGVQWTLSATPDRASSPAVVGFRNKDVLVVRKRRAAIPARAADGQRRLRGILGCGLSVSEIDQPVLAELRMESNIHQASEASGSDWGQTADRRGIENAIANDAQTSRALGDQHSAIRKKRHTPGMIEALCHHRDVNAVHTRTQVPRTVAQGRSASATTAASAALPLAALPWSSALRSCGRLPACSCGRLLLNCSDVCSQREESQERNTHSRDG